MRVFRRLLPTLALFVVPALAAQRPWNWGLTGGWTYQSDDRWHRVSNLGPSIQAYAEHRLTGGLAGRAELHVFYYGFQNPPTFSPVAGCPPGSVCPLGASSGLTHELGIAALTAEAKLADLDEHIIRSYLLIGGGLYGAFQHPVGEHPVRAGVNVGVGWQIGRRGLLELRYHWIAGWKGGGLSVGGPSLGLRF